MKLGEITVFFAMLDFEERKFLIKSLKVNFIQILTIVH